MLNREYSLFSTGIQEKVFICSRIIRLEMGIRVILFKFREVSHKYPVVRGMAAYSVIWPAGCLIQQKLISKEELNYLQALRFSIYGGFFVAPTLYGWLTIATRMWPQVTFKSAITKVTSVWNHFHFHIMIYPFFSPNFRHSWNK